MNVPPEVIETINVKMETFPQFLKNTSYSVWYPQASDIIDNKLFFEIRNFLTNYSLTAHLKYGWSCMIVTPQIPPEVTTKLNDELGVVGQPGYYNPCLRWPVEPENLDDVFLKVQKLIKDYPVLAYKSVTGWKVRQDPGFVGYDCIAVAPTTNKFDIPRFEQVDGVNYGLDTEDIINELKKLDEKYGLDFIGPAEIQLHRIPQNEELEELKEWLLEFCPEATYGYEYQTDLLKGRICLGWD